MAIGKFSNVHTIVDDIIETIIEDDWICVDATVGNGLDACKIVEKVKDKGIFYGFDIQKRALENTKELFESLEYEGNNIFLFEDNHENIRKYVKSNIDFFIMNLGYLPGGDKNITTKWKSTISFIKNALEIININGIGIIVFYPGHKEGYDELLYVSEYLSELDQKSFNVLKYEFINQKNNPPQLVVIERI